MSGPATSTSRAFWEMKAEQVMDRVFANALHSYRRQGPAEPAVEAEAAAPEAPIELVEVREEPRPFAAGPAAAASGPVAHPAPPPPPAATPAPQHRAPARPGRTAAPALGWSVAGLTLSPRLALVGLGSIAVMGAGASLVFWKGWSEASFDLRQERTVRLLENLRGIGGEATASAPAAAGKPAAAAAGADGALPPPPPDEPWIQELGQLPAGDGGNQAEVLRVPVSGTLNRPAPAASGGGGSRSAGPPAAAAPSGPVPELVGVVQIPGRSGSAIFQVGGSSTNALVGDQIGSSGWRLRSASGDTAVIEKGGVERRISISSGF